MSDNKKDYISAIQYLLYCYPLCNYVNREKVNVLVLGYSDIAERFIDFAFEMAQVNGYKLNITVASDNADAKKEYLKAKLYQKRLRVRERYAYYEMKDRSYSAEIQDFDDPASGVHCLCTCDDLSLHTHRLLSRRGD